MLPLLNQSGLPGFRLSSAKQVFVGDAVELFLPFRLHSIARLHLIELGLSVRLLSTPKFVIKTCLKSAAFFTLFPDTNFSTVYGHCLRAGKCVFS